MAKTSLGEINEIAILAELDPIIKKYAKQQKLDAEVVETSVDYLWRDRAAQRKEAVRRYLSANEIGPYGGR